MNRNPTGNNPVFAGLRWLALLPLLATAGFASTADENGDAMVPAADLRVDARIARERGLVLMLEFSSADCAYCRKLEALFLLPMQRNPGYDDKVLIRSVSLDAYQTLIDFEGHTVDTREFAARYGASLTPTLVFLGPDGRELSEKLVGIWSEDFYGEFIDNRIDTALSAD
ncbi:MAG: thioredoxin fold domain-containing protein [Gammaproteobacteria bacterium]|jgi:thioredoxin-related protein